MINIRITPESSKKLYAEIQHKIDGAKELNSVITKDELMSTAFSIGSLKFIKRTNMQARSDKKSFHHVYEWNKVGSESGRLFRLLKKRSSGGAASVYYKFNNSKNKVPIPPALKVPGKTGKSVTKSGIFKNKAEVMENGKSTSFITNRTIAFLSDGSTIFVPSGKKINIKNPGGAATSGSFEKHFRMWWMANFPHILNNAGVIVKLEKNVARALNRKNAGRQAARLAISQTLQKYKITGSVI